MPTIRHSEDGASFAHLSPFVQPLHSHCHDVRTLQAARREGRQQRVEPWRHVPCAMCKGAVGSAIRMHSHTHTVSDT